MLSEKPLLAQGSALYLLPNDFGMQKHFFQKVCYFLSTGIKTPTWMPMRPYEPQKEPRLFLPKEI